MKKKKKLIVIPLAGLGNRMRTLSSCVQIAKRYDRELVVVWPVNTDLGCEMEAIFRNIGVAYTVPPTWVAFLLFNIYRLKAINKFHSLYKLVSQIFYSQAIFDNDIYDTEGIVEINEKHSTVLIASCLAFNTQDYQLFDFTDEISEDADFEMNKIGSEYVGIHVRRTDHVNTIKHSPNSNYYLKIDQLIKDNPSQNFFLATDDQDTKSDFKNRYGNRIHTLDRKLGRSDYEGIRNGVVEMIMLSRSVKMLCSVISSYSSAAIHLGNIQDVIFVDTFLEGQSLQGVDSLPANLKNL